MAVVMMGTDDKKPFLHDFFGMICGENRALEPETEASASASVGASSGVHGLVSGTSDLGSERQPMNNFEVFQFHGRKSGISGPEVATTYLGRKRSNSDSAFMGLTRDRMLPVGSDSPESSRLMKEVVSQRLGRTHDDEMLFAMQPPPRPISSSLILHPPVSSRPDALVSKWERSMPTNPGAMVHYPSRFGQSGAYVDKLSSSYTYRDANVSATLISQAADEGSRTGIKGSGVVNVINPNSVAGEKTPAGMLPCSQKLKSIIEPESSHLPSCHSSASSTRQMTIFYAGQAHVFDDVHPNKADVIMALAGSNGGSWSTTYSSKSSMHPAASESKVPSGENEVQINKLAFQQDLNRRLSIQGSSGHGLSQVAGIPVTGDPPNLTSGGRAIKDTRPVTPAAEPDAEGKRDV